MLSIHGTDPKPRGTIGASVYRFDEAPLFQTFKKPQIAIDQDMAVARIAADIAYFAVRQAFEMNLSALCQNMQNTLFVFRYIHRIIF